MCQEIIIFLQTHADIDKDARRWRGQPRQAIQEINRRIEGKKINLRTRGWKINWRNRMQGTNLRNWPGKINLHTVIPILESI